MISIHLTEDSKRCYAGVRAEVQIQAPAAGATNPGECSNENLEYLQNQVQ
jgi:hypothetical protein